MRLAGLCDSVYGDVYIETMSVSTKHAKKKPCTCRLLRPSGLLVCVCFCLFVCLVSAGVPTHAATYYVAETGSDSQGDGSLAAPWASIDFAISQVQGGDEVLVRPGTYFGRQRLDRQFDDWVRVRSEVQYAAKLRYDNGAALIAYSATHVVIEGFDIAHAPDNTGALVIQIQDLLGAVAGEGDGSDAVVSNIILRNNIIHSSTNNDLLKVNNGAQDILVEGNLFFNQAGSDEHIDINSVLRVTVQDNIFLNTSARTNTSSFVVIKDSNGNSDSLLGARDITVRRNVFLNWFGSSGQSFLRVGEDGTSHYEAVGVLIENNLLLGNSAALMRAALTIQGSQDVTVRNNTVSGDLPARSYAARLIAGDTNPGNDALVFLGNVFTDPTGTMDNEGYSGVDVFDAPADQNQQVSLNTNLFFNGANPVPADNGQFVSAYDDANAVFADPLLASPEGLVAPVWDGLQFADGSSTIGEAFRRLVDQHAVPGPGSPLIDPDSLSNAAEEDILGRERGVTPDLGAYESNPPLQRIFADRFEFGD
jgi:hypothetical protein